MDECFLTVEELKIQLEKRPQLYWYRTRQEVF